MSGVNKVILVGNLGKDPEMRSFPDGGQIANTSLATSEKWTDKQSGEKKEATEWHNLVFRNRLAEIAGEYLRKGSKVYIEGAIRTRKWQDQQGQDRYTTEINVREMQMLGGNDSQQSQAPSYNAPQQQPAQRPAPQPPSQGAQNYAEATGASVPQQGGMTDDDIPF